MNGPYLVQYGVALFAAIVAVVIEHRTTEIPNIVTLGSVVAGLGVALMDGAYASHAGGFAVAAAVMLAIYRTELLGGGTVKLVIGLGTIVGFRPALVMLAVTIVLGALALASLRLRKLDVEIRGSPYALLGVVATAVAVQVPALQSVFK